jgi:hypothetical protein
MSNEFDDVMAQRTDEELIAILKSPKGDYQPAALQAAQRVFKERKLPEEKVAVINKHIAKEKAIADIKANEPLETYYKVIAFLFPGVANFLVSGIAFSEGYGRKAKEWSRATLYGYLFYGGLILLLIILELG